MTENEAKDILRIIGFNRAEEGDVEGCEAIDMAMNALEKVQAFEAIGTVEEFKALKEKDEPKKAKISRKHHEAYCPICKEFVADDEFWVLSEYTHYCEYCGQAILGTEWE